MKYDSIMLDLETMSTANNAAIASIGMFKFDSRTVQEFKDILPEQKFEQIVSLKSSQEHGLHICGDTVLWWMKQDGAAQMRLQDGAPLPVALSNANRFIDRDDYYLWGNGATFDNVILRNAYKAANIKFPLPYRQDMCYRTMKNYFREFASYVPYGTKHDALYDAITQGLHLQKILKKAGPPNGISLSVV